MATKKYESMRIMSLEGSMLCKGDVFTAPRTESPIPKLFEAFLTRVLIP